MKTLTIGFVLLSLAIHAQSVPPMKPISSTTQSSSATKESSPAVGEAKAKSEMKVSDEEGVNEGPAAKNEKREAVVASIEPEALAGFEHYAPQLQQLIRDALALTKLNLTYTFGASNPKQGGMDCSGTIWYLLNSAGLKGVPRQSNEMAGWVQSNTLLHRTPTADSLKHPEFSALQPGDLLFWSGTYETAPRKIPVTHVMLYLGKLKKSGRAVVFGASDGRVYQGERRTGVSVFDFSLPSAGGTSSFYGYGLIPGVGRIAVKVPTPPEPIVAKVSTTPVKESMNEITNATSKSAVKEDIRPAVVPEAKPATAATPNAQPSAAVRYTTRDEPPATISKPKTASAATTASSTSAKPKSVAQSSPSTSKAKTKTTTTTKPATTKKKAPPPTPQEQLSKAAKKIGNSFKELFSN